jgi:hypothetical protein
MKIKEGVKIEGIKFEIITIIPQLDWLLSMYNKPLVITSALDGLHIKGSLHYKGLAIDIRLPFGDSSWNYNMTQMIQKMIGNAYDVVLERDHIHIEYDPEQ